MSVGSGAAGDSTTDVGGAATGTQALASSSAILSSGGLTFRLWDLATGAELRRHHAHNALSFQAAFSPDGQTVYSVSADETLAAWRIGDPSLPTLLAWIAANRYVRELTCDERAQYGVAPLCR